MRLVSTFVIVVLTVAVADVASAALILKVIDELETPMVEWPIMDSTGESSLMGLGGPDSREHFTSAPSVLSNAKAGSNRVGQGLLAASPRDSQASSRGARTNFLAGEGIGTNLRAFESGSRGNRGAPFTGNLPFSDLGGIGDLARLRGSDLKFVYGTNPGGREMVLPSPAVPEAMVNPEPASFTLWVLAAVGALWTAKGRRAKFATA